MNSLSPISNLALAIVTAIAIASPAAADDTASEVKMLNVGSNGEPTVFEPEIIRVAPGTLTDFIAEDFGHDAVAVEGLIPAGAERFEGYKNADLNVQFDVEGVYVYECTSHQGAGMVGLVIVGDAGKNLDAVLGSYRTNAHLSDKAKDKLQILLGRVQSGN